MRIWQNFREWRTGLATASALTALLFGALQVRELFSATLNGVPTSDPTLASTLLVAFVSLAGGVLTLRRGNLVFLLLAWSFVVGNRVAALVALGDELASAYSAENALLGVLVANLDLILATAGTILAFVASALRRPRRA